MGGTNPKSSSKVPLWSGSIQNPKLVLSVRAASRREVVGVASVYDTLRERREVSKILKPRTLVVRVNPKSKIQNPKSVDLNWWVKLPVAGRSG